MTIQAVLFDVDGTLVDSNYRHVDAWSRALFELGHPVDAWRIHKAIGLDSALLVTALLGERAEDLGEKAEALHRCYYGGLLHDLRPLNGARELVKEVARRGQTAVLATLAPDYELEVLRKVLQVDEFLLLTISSDDVAVGKPKPDIVQAALNRAGVSASDAVFIGDSRWDVEASTRAGVKCVALRSGGSGGLELFNAGAFFVWDDAAELLAHYSETFE